MAGGVLRRLMHLATKRFHPSPREADAILQNEPQLNVSAHRVSPAPMIHQDDFSFEVDFSGISLGIAFQELLLGIMGLPSPFPKEERVAKVNRSGFSVSNASLKELYLRRELREDAQAGFLVRGVIYDMRAMAMKLSAEEVKELIQKHKQRDERDAKDWSNLLHGGLELNESKVQDVSANEVMERLGLQNVTALRERVGRPAMDSVRKSKLAEKQRLEETLGTSIRAKYADRIRQKKVMADARREQGRFSGNQTPIPSLKLVEGMECKCLVAPGSPALVRYLQERGISQALLARGPQEDLTSLLEQLGNFKFEELKQLESGAVPSEGMLSSICEKWGLPAKQVIVVVTDDLKEDALKSAAAKGFFICRMANKQKKQVTPTTATKAEENTTLQTGVRSWFNKLVEGTLHLDKEDASKQASTIDHFRVLDMTELKWVIEDLNGVSYRPTTFVRGFQ